VTTVDGATDMPEPTPAELTEMYRLMLLIRRFEEAVMTLHRRGMIPGPVHLSIGQEGEIVGACRALRLGDFMTGNHRSHGHPIAKGAKVAPLMAELMGKRTGVCGGKAGSMHLADFSVGSLGESGIVGSALPVAAGAGLSAQIRGTDEVCLAFFGDGAVNIGAFHESMNLAAVWKLPVIYFCENNHYAVTTPSAAVTSQSLTDRAGAYGVKASAVDGQDCVAVWKAVTAAAASARIGGGPSFIEAVTYRYRDHAEFGRLGDAIAYRGADEMEQWQSRDPIVRHKEQLRRHMDDDQLDEIEAFVTEEVSDAVRFAQSSDFPDAGDALTGLYSNPIPNALAY
jgi:acetoin:2,6-dichlorophenolindophenol oxidoreductase subunit alpha